MRALIQRAESANVTVGGNVVASIGKGFLVFLGVGHDDGTAEADKLWAKVRKLRIFPDDAGHATGFSLEQVGGSVLVVSQFTLYADCKKGNRPSFGKAGDPKAAENLYEYFCACVRRDLGSVECGEFGAHMNVSLANDGPFTIWLDTDEL